MGAATAGDPVVEEADDPTHTQAARDISVAGKGAALVHAATLRDGLATGDGVDHVAIVRAADADLGWVGVRLATFRCQRKAVRERNKIHGRNQIR